MESTQLTKDLKVVKEILIVAALAVIIYLAVVFALSLGAILIVSIVIGLSIYGAYELWYKYARPELMKKEENFDILKGKEDDEQ